jgi:hypothetical protein
MKEKNLPSDTRCSASQNCDGLDNQLLPSHSKCYKGSARCAKEISNIQKGPEQHCESKGKDGGF